MDLGVGDALLRSCERSSSQCMLNHGPRCPLHFPQQGSVPCGESCKCVDCKNCFDGSSGGDISGGGARPRSSAKTVARVTTTKGVATTSKGRGQSESEASAAVAAQLLREEEEEHRGIRGGSGSIKLPRRAASMKALKMLMSSSKADEDGGNQPWDDALEGDEAAGFGMAPGFEVRSLRGPVIH